MRKRFYSTLFLAISILGLIYYTFNTSNSFSLKSINSYTDPYYTKLQNIIYNSDGSITKQDETPKVTQEELDKIKDSLKNGGGDPLKDSSGNNNLKPEVETVKTEVVESEKKGEVIGY